MIDYDCPCGGVAVYSGSLMPGGRVECRSCWYAGPHRDDPDEARAAWNSQVADWIQRNKGTDDVFAAVSRLRPEIESAARRGLEILDATSNLEKAFSAIRIHLELVVQELDEWALLDTLVAQAQNRIKAEVNLRVEGGRGTRSQGRKDMSFGLYDKVKEAFPPWMGAPTTSSLDKRSVESRNETVALQSKRTETAAKRKYPSRVIRRRGKKISSEP